MTPRPRTARSIRRVAIAGAAVFGLGLGAGLALPGSLAGASGLGVCQEIDGVLQCDAPSGLPPELIPEFPQPLPCEVIPELCEPPIETTTTTVPETTTTVPQTTTTVPETTTTVPGTTTEPPKTEVPPTTVAVPSVPPAKVLSGHANFTG